ncbi:hypothetical protein [Nonomuraea sp. SYSU D8015]|uniref:hypothetical protein n=1 Tax=Nonomuraea sp. SYSU D8015 TaxID=2593644 RepID=UPI0016601B3B|nr:hypothetical protein [Nonomuraea sp. SYSU D8015]
MRTEAEHQRRILAIRAEILESRLALPIDTRGRHVMDETAKTLRGLAALLEADPAMAETPQRWKPAATASRIGRDLRVMVLRANNPLRSSDERTEARARYEAMYASVVEHANAARELAPVEWLDPARCQTTPLEQLRQRSELLSLAAHLLRVVARHAAALPELAPQAAQVAGLADTVDQVAREFNRTFGR